MDENCETGTDFSPRNTEEVLAAVVRFVITDGKQGMTQYEANIFFKNKEEAWKNKSVVEASVDIPSVGEYIEQCESLITELREALEFYADPDNVMTGFDVASGSRYVKRTYHDVAKEALLSAESRPKGEGK